MEARDAAKCLTMHRTALHKEEASSPRRLAEPQPRNPAQGHRDSQHFLL